MAVASWPLAGTGFRSAAAPAAELLRPAVETTGELVGIGGIHLPLERAIATANKFPSATHVLTSAAQAAADVDSATAIGK